MLLLLYLHFFQFLQYLVSFSLFPY